MNTNRTKSDYAESTSGRLPKLLNTRQAAEYLGVAHKTLYASWKLWKLPAVRIGGGPNGALRFKVRDLDKLIEEWTTE